MTPEIISWKPRHDGEFATAAVAPLESMDFAPLTASPGDLLSHVRRLHRRGRAAAGWMALAVVAGTITAVAFVNFFAR